MKQTKVLHVISNPCIGGAQSLIRDMVLNSKNHYVYVFRKTKENMFSNIKNKTYYYNSKKNYKFNPKIIFDICKLIDKKNIQILHLHLNKPLIYGSIIKIFRPKIKLIYHEHGPILIPHNNKENLEYVLPLRLLHHTINRFILISKAVKNAYVNKLNIKDERTVILYHLVDFHNFNTKKNDTVSNYIKKKLNINKKEYCIGFVGRLSNVKGCQYLIEALPLLKFNFKLIIVGDGELKKELKQQVVKLNLAEKVIFLGYIKEVFPIYSLFDILVMPSLREGAGLALFEAQASGVPVIGSDVSAINEFIIPKYNGLLFKAKDPVDLSKKITLIHNNSNLRKNMSKNALKNIKKYSLKKYLKDLNKIYIEVLNDTK